MLDPHRKPLPHKIPAPMPTYIPMGSQAYCCSLLLGRFQFGALGVLDFGVRVHLPTAYLDGPLVPDLTQEHLPTASLDGPLVPDNNPRVHLPAAIAMAR